ALFSTIAAARPWANPNATRYDAIVPGADWLDTDGVLIRAHGGATVRTNDGTFYWLGEDRRPGGTHFTGYNWKNEGLVFKPVEGTPTASDLTGERPKVVYSEQTKQWVVYFHSDTPSHTLHYQAIALSSNVTRPYVYQDPYFPLGLPSQDLGMFVDDDSTFYDLKRRLGAHDLCIQIIDIAYASYGFRRNNSITRLRDDRLNAPEITYTSSGTNLEAPGMFKENGTYYHIFSQKTGFRPNDAQLFTAPALIGPWTRQSQLAPNDSNTWESQNTFELTIKGTKKTTHIFMGDRWDRDKGGGVNPRVDIKTGEVSHPKGTPYETEKGIIAGGANVTSCPTCSGESYVTGITSNSSVTTANAKGTGRPQWLAIYYVNTDLQTTALHRYAGVSVNGAAGEVVKQRTTAEGVVVSVPLQVQFAKGSKNVTISGVSGR
ncbi:hypothetical protein FRC11_011041, partial [Ceratobasidium sp. 423]